MVFNPDSRLKAANDPIKVQPKFFENSEEKGEWTSPGRNESIFIKWLAFELSLKIMLIQIWKRDDGREAMPFPVRAILT